MRAFADLLYLVFALCIANIGNYLHGSIVWTIFDFFFAPFVLIKWFFCKEITLTIIKHSFDWFLK